MAYQVYDYEGKPYLIWSDEDLPIQYTTIPPRSGMYYPVKFHEDTGEWEELGTPPNIPPLPTPETEDINTEEIIALLLYNDAIKSGKIKQLEEEVLLLKQPPEEKEGEEIE